MEELAGRSFQDELASLGYEHCWGCGPANEHGLHLRSHWAGDDAICRWQPRPHHIVRPGVVCGGIVATLIDCHGTATAAAAAYRARGLRIGEGEALLYATVSVHVDYLRPTPSEAPILLRARVERMAERRVTVSCSLYSGGLECARGAVVAARVPPTWGAAG